MSDERIIREIYSSIGQDPHGLGPDVARLEVHQNQVVGQHLVPGLEVKVDEKPQGISATIVVKEGVAISKPVHLCFGVLPEKGLQVIEMSVRMEDRARASILAHCTFPNAVQVEHRMDAEIVVGRGAEYSYFERHVHGPKGGVLVLPKARVTVLEGGRFKTEFELIRGRVGRMELDYEVVCHAHAVLEMLARILGRGDDFIRIRESGKLVGEYARGVLTSHIALRDHATARVENVLRAEAAYSRGHVDCKEVVQDAASASAVPIVEVTHPKAHVTHEAAIGSVDSKQLETLMSRGLSEDEAVDLIIQGLLQ
jgi:Fe-S cluster assembly scaffold protein SufB